MPADQQDKSDRGRFKALAIYGGSFSPPHLGHVSAALALYRELQPDRLLIMPSLISPREKSEPAEKSEHRVAMCRAAFEEEAGFCGRVRVSDYELSNNRVSYTYLTVDHFADMADKLYLLMGTDMLFRLDSWKNFRGILEKATVCFAERRENTPQHRKETDGIIEKYRTEYGADIIRLEHDRIEISSTELRKRIESGESCSKYLPAGVEEYIRLNRLYGAK